MMQHIVPICLYGLLGGVLSSGGISVMDKPWEFFGIMLIVVLIEQLAKNGWSA